ESAGVLHLPGLEVRKVDLDRSGLRVDVEIEVVLARYPRARARLAHALAAGHRAGNVHRRIEDGAESQLLTGEPLHGNRFRPRPRSPRAPATLPAHYRRRVVCCLRPRSSEGLVAVRVFAGDSVIPGVIP